LDVWGRVRNLVAAADDRAKASAEDLAALNLSLHAELATNYFALRGNDENQRVLDETVRMYKKAFLLLRNRYQGGASPPLDMDLAETQLKTAETLATNLRLQRAQLEHAIAVLIGESPSNFSISLERNGMKAVSIDPNVPSILLERRPDILAAEQRMKAANADIGVAKAAFFPTISLDGLLGFESRSLAKLIQMPSLFWSIGPLATMTLFDGGRIAAFVRAADASYFEAIANYRQTVLIAFQEVEDSLIAIHRLNQEMASQQAAVKAANRALHHALKRLEGGLITYLDVVVVQTIALQAELANINIRTQRQIASVQLIKAIGCIFPTGLRSQNHGEPSHPHRWYSFLSRGQLLSPKSVDSDIEQHLALGNGQLFYHTPPVATDALHLPLLNPSVRNSR